jgi:putative MATE family efflux protein
MRLLGSTATILPYSKAYGGIILWGAPWMAASFVMNVNLRSEGSAMLAMFGIAGGAVLNVILDPIFIFGFRMGIAGAALATILSQLVSFGILLSHYLMKRSALRIRLKDVEFSRGMYREILGSGMPTLSRQMVASVSTVVTNVAAGPYGDAAIAGMSVVQRVMLFMWSVIIGFGQGFQPVAAFNYGAALYKRVHEAFWFSVKVGTVILLVFASLAGSFAPMAIRLFRNEQEVVLVGAFALRMQCLTLPLNAFVVMANMLFQYIGKPGRSTILALSRQGLVLIPSILILASLFGLRGLQVSQAVADSVTLLLSIPLTVGILRSLKEGKAIG